MSLTTCCPTSSSQGPVSLALDCYLPASAASALLWEPGPVQRLPQDSHVSPLSSSSCPHNGTTAFTVCWTWENMQQDGYFPGSKAFCCHQPALALLARIQPHLLALKSHSCNSLMGHTYPSSSHYGFHPSTAAGELGFLQNL